MLWIILLSKIFHWSLTIIYINGPLQSSFNNKHNKIAQTFFLMFKNDVSQNWGVKIQNTCKWLKSNKNIKIDKKECKNFSYFVRISQNQIHLLVFSLSWNRLSQENPLLPLTEKNLKLSLHLSPLVRKNQKLADLLSPPYQKNKNVHVPKMQHNTSKIFIFYFLSRFPLFLCLIGLIGGLISCLIGLIGGIIGLIGGIIGLIGCLTGLIGIIGGLIGGLIVLISSLSV